MRRIFGVGGTACEKIWGKWPEVVKSGKGVVSRDGRQGRQQKSRRRRASVPYVEVILLT